METHRSGSTLSEVAREHILETLARCGGNRTHAANVLDISVRALRDKLRCYAGQGFEVPSPRGNERMTDDHIWC
jgi:DNA-binding NtrC family response regulator